MSEVTEVEEVIVDEQPEQEPEQELEQPEQEQSEESEESDEPEVVVSIGEEPPPPEEPRAPDWVRELRKSHRELQRKNKELEAKLSSQSVVPASVPTLGKKPTLEDHDYDAEKFESSLADWYERKRKVDEVAAQARVAEEEQKKSWQSKLDAYGKARSELKVRDFEDAEDVTQQALDVTQQGIVLQGAENPALLVYALGKNPKKAAELGAIKDPVKFAFAVAKLEKDLKVTQRKSAPPPERVVQGNAGTSGSVDSSLDKLRAEAERTGDYTKVMRYKAQMRAKGK
jgi:hypothetical protein